MTGSASVTIVHNDPVFSKRAATALRDAGHEVDVFADSLVALNEIEAAHRIEVLVTRVNFPSGMPNGVSLALVLRVKYPRLKVIFTAREEREVFTKGIGEFLPHPVDVAKLVETVRRLVQSNSDKLPPTGVIPSL